MNLHHQQQRGNVPGNNSSPPSSPYTWEGDQMLHIYVCDYLRKRGFSQAALALRLEAGIEPDRQVPIDAPQSLLFEWWVVFWEIFASRSLDPSSSATGLAADARTYTVGQASSAMSARDANPFNGSLSQPIPQNAAPSGYMMPASGNANSQPQITLGRRPSQMGLSDRSNEASTSTQAGSSSKPSPPGQQQQQQQSKGPTSTLPQLDLEASQKLGLTRPASRVVIQQCMDMMNFGAKQIDHLTTEERQALAKRVTRLQTAQNDAQMRLAQLHGLQPPKSSLTSPSAGAPPPASQPSQVAQGQQQQQALPPRVYQELSANTNAYLAPTRQKRKESPNLEAGAERLNHPFMTGPGAQQQQIGGGTAPVPLLRRLSYQAQSSIPSIPSPLTPSTNGGAMPFSQVSPHPMMQHSPASSAPTPMNPPARRPSVFGGPEPSSQANSPMRGNGAGAMFASGLPTASPGAGAGGSSSVSPLGEWHGQDGLPPPLQQQQRPVVMPSSIDAHQQSQAFMMKSNNNNGSSNFNTPRLYMAPSYMGQAQNRQPAAATAAAGGKDVGGPAGGFQISMPATKPSVFATAGDDATAFNGMQPGVGGGAGGAGGGGGGSGPVTPFGDLEYDFNVFLSNSTQMNREETSALARQMGNVGGS